ncbi:acyl-CoA dehydrogenase family protein [Aeromicrobium terrae]|uniref:Acyl-CoA dehydrogenase n=1 Tax=Aeromicrobium terrae TaxID=2498846 RepID=A0A5C8NJ75_9ACTN|nr:acyl-CoA dehydrogenase family protein [Aeromicrobium terrae]TXL60841.1 acyl-CoA dehydrogenase [Aeromicrobium terrae]
MTDLVPTREHEELATSVRQLLQKGKSPEDTWFALCDQIGAAALTIPEEHGGAGFTLAETYVVLEELGYALTPSPLLSTVVASRSLAAEPREGAPATEATDSRSLGTESREGAPATEATSESLAAQLLPRIAEGTTATLATGDVTWNGALSGTATPVLHADVAEFLLVAAKHDDGVGLFSVDPEAMGLTRTPLAGMDPTLSFATLDFTDVDADPISMDATEALAAAHRVGMLATAALQVGCAQRGLDMTVAYAKEREQFGRPIGSFQALKHRMADMLVKVQMSRSGAWAAVQAHVHGTPNADRLAAAAASYCSEAALHVASETIQLHGGIAITWEHDAHLVLKRAQSLSRLYGAPHEQRAALIP